MIGIFLLQIFLWAHRGASSIAPENTISAFEKAIGLGADGIELDVQCTRDDSVIVMHDLTVDRTTNGKGYVKDLTYEYIKSLDAGGWFSPSFAGEKVPTLSEVLEKFCGKALLVIELKGNDHLLPRKVINILKKYNAFENIILTSFNKFHLDSIKNIEPRIRVAINIGALNYDSRYLTYEFINFNGDMPFDTGLIVFYKNKGINLVVYTINDINKILDLAKKGINIFITDYPQYKFYLREIEQRKEEKKRIKIITENTEKGAIIMYNPYDRFIYVKIYDTIGRKVSEHCLNPGFNIVNINGANGVYFVKSSDDLIKFILVR